MSIRRDATLFACATWELHRDTRIVNGTRRTQREGVSFPLDLADGTTNEWPWRRHHPSLPIH